MLHVFATTWAAALFRRHKSEEQMAKKPLSEAEKQRALGSLRMRTPSPTKRCPNCGLTKSRSEFGVRKNGYSRARCRPCEVTKWKRWKQANPAKVYEANRRVSLKRYFGITEATFVELLVAQQARCAICGRSESEAPRGRLHVDHCHETALIRGLLCGHCNTAIGLLKEDPQVLTAAIRYLNDPPAAHRKLFAVPGLPSGQAGQSRLPASTGALPLFEVDQ